jgi:hypothetical protein
VYLNEWMYKELMQSSDEDRIVQIYDLSKACLSNLKGDVGQIHGVRLHTIASGVEF